MQLLYKVIDSIKTLNFESLNQLLDENKSYMDVSKTTFLKALKNEIKKEESKGFTGFDKVLKGTCGACNEGCEAYSFVTNDLSLDLFFDIKHEELVDIYLCNDFLHNDKIYNNISFSFYEETKINFVPSEQYLYHKQNTDRAINDFKKLSKSTLISIEDLDYWKKKHMNAVNHFEFNDPFALKKYNGFTEFNELRYGVVCLLDYYYCSESCRIALKEYLFIKNEKDLVKWLIKHKEIKLYDDFERTENWQKTGFILLSESSDVVVDCLSCLEAFKFAELYSNEEFRILKKYKPTKEHYDKFGNIHYNLVTNLKLHNKYLDILPKRLGDKFLF